MQKIFKYVRFYCVCSLTFTTQHDILADSDTEHLLDILSLPANVKIYDCQKTTINTEATLQSHQIRSLFQADQATSLKAKVNVDLYSALS